MRPLSAGAMAAAACVLLGACGNIPQPFRHDGAAVPSLARPKFVRSVTVRPPQSIYDGDLLAAALVKQLQAEDVPALVSSRPAFGHVIEAVPTPPGLTWVLRAPDGSVLGTHANVPRGMAEPHLTRSARDVAMALAPYLTDPDAAPMRPAARDSRPALRLAPLGGLPGDGDKTLTAAMRRALERAGLRVADTDALYTVEGRVTVSPSRPGQDNVTLVWIVRRIANNEELARIDQSGDVPRGQLDGPWGGLARDMAEGGAVGVAEAVGKAGR